jgi:hypothetical protein
MSALRQIRLALCLGTIIAAGATASWAQSAPASNLTANTVGANRLEIAGSVPEGCSIAPPRQQAVANASISGGGTSAEIMIQQFVDPLTAVPQAASVSMAFPVLCNTAHTVTLTTRGGLEVQAGLPPAGPGFRSHVDYQLSLNWAGQQVSQATNSGPSLQISSPNAASGDLFVNLQIAGGGLPLVAGTYSDSLVLNVRPAS